MIQFYAPPKVWERLADKSIPKNGCGSGWNAWLVPDKWLGLDFTISCAIHDEMYALGKTLEDKDEADRVFLNNMLRAVNARPVILQPAGRFLAWYYHDKVVKYGAPSFWDGKNNQDEMRSAKIEAVTNGAVDILKVVTVL